MYVTNVSGTSGMTCSCGSWLKHWLNHSGATQLPEWCVALGCVEAPEVGAHVSVETKSGVHVVPFCNGCNQRVGKFQIGAFTSLASAKTSSTCG